MNQHYTNEYTTEQHSLLPDIRRAELKNQKWNRAKSQLIANNENIILTDAHWAVLKYLRESYLKSGLPKHARLLSESLNKVFFSEGGKEHLHKLFPGGAITQGSRLANLPTPADSVEGLHGYSY